MHVTGNILCSYGLGEVIIFIYYSMYACPRAHTDTEKSPAPLWKDFIAKISLIFALSKDSLSVTRAFSGPLLTRRCKAGPGWMEVSTTTCGLKQVAWCST